MIYVVKAIVTVLVTMLMQTCVVSTVSSTPAEATEAFLAALKKQDAKVMERYMDNEYVNFLYNTEGDADVIGKMNKALFSSFSYEVEKVKQKDGVAAARVVVTGCDFSDVMDSYEKKSYDYIMDNLYEDDIADKDKLASKCLEMYVAEIEKVAEEAKTVETVVFIPMTEDGFYGWNVIMTDELMKAVLGNLEMPTAK
ncbi:MAG: hypothetical protein Q4B18_04930 [Bacillota bacterium]|nr:hypothetical protein [Bacillota bacterium]